MAIGEKPSRKREKSFLSSKVPSPPGHGSDPDLAGFLLQASKLLGIWENSYFLDLKTLLVICSVFANL